MGNYTKINWDCKKTTKTTISLVPSTLHDKSSVRAYSSSTGTIKSAPVRARYDCFCFCTSDTNNVHYPPTTHSSSGHCYCCICRFFTAKFAFSSPFRTDCTPGLRTNYLKLEPNTWFYVQCSAVLLIKGLPQ